MKVAVFTDTFFPEINGVANTLTYLSNYFNTHNIAALFFAPDYEKDSQHVIDANVIRIKGLQFTISPSSRIALPSYRFMRDKILQFKPDVIHVTTQFGIGRLGVKYAEEFDIPLIMSYHTNFDQYLAFHQLEFLSQPLWDYTKYFYKRADLTLCPSKDTLQALEERGFHNLGIWSRGADLIKFNQKHYDESLHTLLGGRNSLIFSYVGRLSVEKDIDIYLEAIKIVNSRIGSDAITFTFTGLGPHASILEEEKLPNIILTGSKSGKALAAQYASTDVFVFPSGTETFGNVLLEAMASALPTISVNAGGVTDFAKNGYNSLVCEYHNPESIADAIITLARNPLLRKRLSIGALETAQSRSWDTIFDKLIHDYNSVQKEHTPVAV